MTGLDAGKDAIMGRASRDMAKADDGQLAGIQEAVTGLLDQFERFMGGDLVTSLCVWRETAQKHHASRSKPDAGVTHLSDRRAG